MSSDFIQNGRPDPDNEEEVLDALVADAKDYFGEDLNDDQLAAVRLLYRPAAKRFAQTQEDLALVVNSAQIDYAEGQALDLLAALIGVTRDQADPATGRVTFSRDSKATTDYIAPSGTRVQTDSTDPIEFETTETGEIPLLDDMEEDLSEYDSSDKSPFSLQSSTVLEGSQTLKIDATDGAEIHQDGNLTEKGQTLEYLTRVESNTVTIFEFGIVDDSNRYQVVVDHSTDRVALEVVDAGTNSTVDEDTSAGVPSAEKIDVEIKWRHDGDFVVSFRDSSDTEFAELNGHDETHDSGGFGFKSGDANGSKYFDFAAGTEVTVDVEAVEDGANGNVGARTITVLPDPPAGINSVTNLKATDGGTEVEDDDTFRDRAKQELGEGSAASAKSLVDAVSPLQGVTSVNLERIDNDSDGEYEGFELIVSGGDTDEIAQKIFDKMAAGDTSHGGINGTAESSTVDVGNGQTETIEFSRPTEVKIYIDADIDATDEYEGNESVQDRIIEYIGGTLNSGNTVTGLESGEDVIIGEVEYAIRSATGVHDVTNLEIGTSSSPTGTSNVSISSNEVAIADATDGTVDVQKV